jgi:hypothetical protein
LSYCYQGHIQQFEDSMHFVNSLGIRGMLADFLPIPGTPDGLYCREWVDMDEPLYQNKTVFPIIMMGFDESNRRKTSSENLIAPFLNKERTGMSLRNIPSYIRPS